MTAGRTLAERCRPGGTPPAPTVGADPGEVAAPVGCGPGWPAVSVVIPVRGDTDALAVAVASVRAQDYPGVVEVVVADGSGDPAVLAAFRRAFAEVVVVDNPVRSTPAGLNRAIAAAAHDVLVRVDARCTLPGDYVRRAVEALGRTGAVNVGGRQRPWGRTRWERAIAAAMAHPLGSGGARYRSRAGAAGPVDTVFLGAFRRTALEAAGGFDETLLRNQDYELNYRLRRGGGTVWFEPDLAVAYRARGGLGALARQYHAYGRYKRVVAVRHPASLRLRQAAPPLLVLGLAGSAALMLAAALPVAAALPGAVAAVLPGTWAAALAWAGFERRAHGGGVRVALALATMHLAWGLGFLRGVRGAPRAGQPGRSACAVDYLLIAGPGRSGSTFLHGLLGAHPGFAAGRVKEAACYRSPRRLARARRAAGARVVLDGTNLAWRDPALERLADLTRAGCKVLLVVLLRDHVDRARSVIAFRASRGYRRGPGGRGLAAAAVRDSLAPADLERLFGLGADVLCVGFEALTRNTASVLDAVASLCGTAPFPDVAAVPVNEREVARHRGLAAAGKLAALLLRALGGGALLERLKASPRVRGLFFRPSNGSRPVPLGAASVGELEALAAGCRERLAARAEPLGEGLWLVRSRSGGRRAAGAGEAQA